MISISTFCSKSRIYFLSLLTDFFRISTNTMDSSVEVDEKLEANICPFCTKAFNSSLQLLKHVVYKHNCLECTKTCQHKAVINQADEPIVKSEITSPENIKIEIVNEPSEEIVNTVQICDDNENLRIQDENVLIKSEFVNPIDEKNIVESPENSNFLRVRTDLFSDQVHTLNCDPVIKCDLCDASFTYKQLVVHKKAGHKCEFCNAIYKSVKAKENHLKKSHSFKCPKCDVTFVSKELLSDHLVSHVNHSFLLEGSHKCAICKLRFSTKMDLQKHKVESHKFSKCEFCDYATKFKSNLKVHKKNFHDEKSKKRKPENLQAKNKKRKPETLHIPSNKPSKKRKVKN